MNFLLITFGTSGDVNPYVGIGAALKARGHSVSLATNPYFKDLITGAGLEFIPIGSRDEFVALLAHPDLWHPHRGMEFLMKQGVLPLLRPSFEIARDFSQTKGGVVLSSWMALGARCAQEKFGIPLITIHPYPIVLDSVETTPVFPGADISRLPRWLKRWMFRLLDVLTDRMLNPEFDQFRKELGLVPVHRILSTWMHSPLLNIGLWPEWFAPPQRDWPPRVILTNFPLYDGGVETMSEELEAFLKEGPPPIAFTAGSAMRQGKVFFEESLDACRRTGHRGVFLTSFAEQVPADLPPSVRVFGYAPFSRLLPRTSAFIHHGGIGSTSQAFAAGIPQIVMPMTHDQPDNAARVQHLGAGVVIQPKNYRGKKIAELLNKFKSDSSYRLRAQEISQLLKDRDGLTRTCELIEQTAARASTL